MKTKLLLVFGLALGFNSLMMAQKNCPRTSVPMNVEATISPQVDEQEHPYGGTFQIICSKNAEKKEVFTTDVLKLIEENRLENEEKILVLSPISKVRILSKKQISAPDFQPIEKLYSFE